MTPNRKRHLEYAQFLLNDSADDKCLPLGTRERLRMMAGRIGLEWEAAEGVANSRRSPLPNADDDESEHAEATPAPPRPHNIVLGRCGIHNNHKWDGGVKCIRCGAFKS